MNDCKCQQFSLEAGTRWLGMGVGRCYACLYLLDLILGLGVEGSLEGRKEELTHQAQGQ